MVVVILGPVADVDVGSLFMGMLFPGLILAGLYILYILGRCIVRPQDGQRLPPDENEPPLLQKLWITAVALVPPVVLIFAVLGTIMLGWATPTEAAAMGALGSVLMTMAYRNFTFPVLKEALAKTILVTAMILTILLAGNIFATVFTISGGLVGTQNLVEAADLSGWATLGILLLLAFVAGFVLDLISIILIIIPIAMPDHLEVPVLRPRSLAGPDLVLHPVPHRDPDELPDPADGPGRSSTCGGSARPRSASCTCTRA